MKHIIPLILVLSLLGCQTPPAAVTPPALTAEHTPLPTATPTQTPTPTEVPLEALAEELQTEQKQTIINNEVMAKMVKKSKETNTFPADLTAEQKAAFFKELNEQSGEKLYYPHWVDVKIDPITKQASVSLNGEWMPITGSENISQEQWGKIITNENIDEAVASGEFVSPIYNELGSERNAEGFIRDYDENIAIVTVLLPIPKNGLVDVSPDNPGLNAQGIPELIIRFIENEKGDMVPIGEVVYQFNYYGLGFMFLGEGSSKVEEVVNESDYSFFENDKYKLFKNAKPLEVYYVFTVSNPQGLLELRKDHGGPDIDKSIGGPNFTKVVESYEAISKVDLNRTGSPVLISPGGRCIMIKTDGKW